MRKLVTVMCLALLLTGALSAQDYKGKGRLLGAVTDEQGRPLEGVTVKLFSLRVQQGTEVKTGPDGRWIAAWIRGGVWNVDFEKVGYAPKKISIEVNEHGKTPEVAVTLVRIEGLAVTDDIRNLLGEGNRLFEEGQYDQAEAKFREILDKNPEAYPVYQNLGNCYFARENYGLAEENYLKVLEKDPRNTDAIVAVGNCYSNRGDSAKALEWYGKVEFEKIDDPIVLYNLGTSYYNNSDFQNALKFYAKAVDKQKGSTDALYQLGLTYLSLQRNAESIAVFEDYLKVDSDSPRAGQVRAFLDFLKKK
ncbi:MAG: tetratricopeptide repeat protein [Candidatus Aminicenantes bacterium]|nr:tetratricopeptide repeat protein [Candidatus Aminicenantes bacterium]